MTRSVCSGREFRTLLRVNANHVVLFFPLERRTIVPPNFSPSFLPLLSTLISNQPLSFLACYFTRRFVSGEVFCKWGSFIHRFHFALLTRNVWRSNWDKSRRNKLNFNRKCLDSLKENPGTKSEVKDAWKAYRRILEQLADILKFGKLTFTRLLLFKIY